MKPKTNSLSLSWLMVVITLLITGCVPSLVNISDIKAVPAGDAIVFGRINVTVEGESLVCTWVMCKTPSGPSLTLKHVIIFFAAQSDSQEKQYIVYDDGSFYWQLPPGSYTITGFAWGRVYIFRDITIRGRVFAEFTIPENKPLIYVGTLTLSFVENRYNILVEDHYDQALNALKSKWPDIRGGVVKNIMQLEKLL